MATKKKAIERSDVPGLKLCWMLDGSLPGQSHHLTKVVWSPNGQMLAIPTQEGTVEVWDAHRGQIENILPARLGTWIQTVAWSPDGHLIAASSGDGFTRLLVPSTGERYDPSGLSRKALEGSIVAWSPNGRLLATGGAEGLQVWDAQTWELNSQSDLGSKIVGLSFSPSGALAVATRGSLYLIRGESFRPDKIADQAGVINGLAWSPDDTTVAIALSSRTVSIWDSRSRRQLRRVEGHTAPVRSVEFSADGRVLASKSDDGTVRIWDASRWNTLAIIDEPAFDRRSNGFTNRTYASIAFHPRAPILATFANEDRTVRIWELDLPSLLVSAAEEPTVAYTTAKIVLVGDSGVGKTGLGWRLAHGSFKEHSSTHGQQFWVFEQLGVTRSDGTECEAVIWDLAGQPDYRLTHALFFDEIDLALILFDPGHHSEPLKGVEYWLRALDRHDKNTPKILVAARADRANPTLTTGELRTFCDRHGITGGFVATSAMSGQGLSELLDCMKSQIAWDAMTTTVTTATFKRIKEYALRAKEAKEREILIDPEDLQSRLQATDRNWTFSFVDMMTAVQHLANHGYLSVIRGTSRGQTILLAPELLANLASSFVLEARRNPNGLGALEEARLLQGDYSFPEIVNLSKGDRGVLLDAVTALFLEHNLCFRERLGPSTFLIFPSLINQKKPADDGQNTVDDVSYTITGRVENVYPALVVLLGYTNTFVRTNQWQNQAQYEMNPGEICGFRQVAERDGEIDLVLNFSPNAGTHVRSLFEGLFETFLSGRDIQLRKYPPVSCPRCAYRPERAEAVKRINEKKSSMYCGECGNRIALPLAATGTARKPEALERNKDVARRRTLFETALARAKALLRDQAPSAKQSTCFVSYAWGVDEHERWVLRLARDLQQGDVEVILDRKDNAAIGSSITEFVNKVEAADFVIVVSTPEYLRKYKNQDPIFGSFVAAEMDIINVRLTGTKEAKNSVLPLLLSGDKLSSVPPLLRGRVLAEFQDEEMYFASLLDLLLTIYRVGAREEEVFDLRESIRAAE